MYLNFSNFRGRTLAGGGASLGPKTGTSVGWWGLVKLLPDGGPQSPQEKTLLLGPKIPSLILFPYTGLLLQIFAWGMPLHAHVFSFTHNAVVLSHCRCVHPQKSDKKFLILIFLWIKTNVAYTRLEVIAKQRSALQVQFITSVKLICYFVLYYCFLHWAHPPNMAVSDLDFYYTLYLWVSICKGTS